MDKNKDIDQMSPDASPVSVRKSGTRRVNNLPLILGITALALFTALIAMVAVNRSNNEIVEQQTPKKSIDTSAMAKDVIGSYGVGLIPSKKSTLAKTQEVLVEPTTSLDEPLMSQPIDHNLPPPIDPEKQQIRMAKMQQFQDAVRAKTTISIPNQLGMNTMNVTTHHTTQTREEMLEQIAEVHQKLDQKDNDLTETYQAQLSKSGSTLDDNTRSSLLSVSASTDRNHSRKVDEIEQGDRWKLNQQMQAPRSCFEIRAGNVIPGIMISGVNSDLPGQIMGQVSQDVYDTATGKYLLIPQGTRLIGTYSSDVAYGQSAVMIAWQRLIFPDGKALDISSMPGADSAGYTGFRDQVNNHYFRIFASAFLLSGVTAGISYSQGRDNNNSNNSNNSNNNSQQSTVSSELSQALGQQLGQVTSQMIAKNMDIAPTLEIRPGYRFNIIVVKDLDFTKPYKSFDYDLKEK